MTTLELKLTLPDEIARRAQSAGLLTGEAISLLLEEAIRRDSGRRLLEVMRELHSSDIAPMTEEEIQAEVDAVRAERRRRAEGH